MIYHAQNLAEWGYEDIQNLVRENNILREEIRVARESAEITASLVVKQFEETERILRRFQMANALRTAVLDSAAQMAIIATDRHGKIIVFNKGAENLLGYDPEEVLEKETPVLFHLESEMRKHGRKIGVARDRSQRGIDILFEYARRGFYEQEEWTYVRKDGSTFPVSMSVNALHGPEGSLEGILCIASDITEKKRAEKALRESERNYRILINNIPNIVFKWYPDGGIDFYDDKIEKLTGYSLDEFLSRKLKWTDLIVDEDRHEFKEKFLKALKSNGTYIRQYRIRKKNGDVAWVEAGSQIIYDENGRIDFVTGAFLDITDRKRAEQALHESEEKYRSLFDSGPNPVFVLDMKNLTILDANRSAEETYGYTREELLGKSFLDLGEFEDIEKGLQWSESQGSPEACFVTQRARHRKKDGTPVYIRMNACPIKYQGDGAIILAATDITESIEKDAQLFQASKMTTLGEMSAGIAHELNQPLNAIKVGGEYLRFVLEKGGEIPMEDFLAAVDRINKQVDRASNIINRLREFGRKSDFRKRRVSFNRVIRLVMGIVGEQFKLQNIVFRVDLEESLPPVTADANRLEQVMFNLLTNARDAIEQGRGEDRRDDEGFIEIRSFVEGDHVAVTVSDNGSGIPDETLGRIFEPFFTTKEVGKGMGLGLSIVYGIIQDYGGHIHIHTREGTGTTFKITLPRADQENREETP